MNTNIENLKRSMPEMSVRIVELCNHEEYYQPGDIGVVKFVDDAGQIHVNWNKGGSIALLPEDKFEYWMQEEKIIEKIRKNISENLSSWSIPVGFFYSFENALNKAEKTSLCITEIFNKEEFNNLKVSDIKLRLIPTREQSIILLTYDK